MPLVQKPIKFFQKKPSFMPESHPSQLSLKSSGKTGFAKMIEDDRVAPFLDSVYGDLKSEYDEKLKEKIGGISLEQFADFATGELCFAMVAKRRKPLTMVMFFDVPEESETLDKLLGVAEENGVEKGDVELEEESRRSGQLFQL